MVQPREDYLRFQRDKSRYLRRRCFAYSNSVKKKKNFPKRCPVQKRKPFAATFKPLLPERHVFQGLC